MRVRLLPIVIVLVGLVLLLELMIGLAHAQTALTPPPENVTQALTAGERCSVDSLTQRATIVALRAELAKLQARIADLEGPLVDQAVAKERAALEAQFRARLNPPATSVFDWQSLTFTAPPVREPHR